MLFILKFYLHNFPYPVPFQVFLMTLLIFVNVELKQMIWFTDFRDPFPAVCEEMDQHQEDVQ